MCVQCTQELYEVLGVHNALFEVEKTGRDETYFPFFLFSFHDIILLEFYLITLFFGIFRF